MKVKRVVVDVVVEREGKDRTGCSFLCLLRSIKGGRRKCQETKGGEERKGEKKREKEKEMGRGKEKMKVKVVTKLLLC